MISSYLNVKRFLQEAMLEKGLPMLSFRNFLFAFVICWLAVITFHLAGGKLWIRQLFFSQVMSMHTKTIWACLGYHLMPLFLF